MDARPRIRTISLSEACLPLAVMFVTFLLGSTLFDLGSALLIVAMLMASVVAGMSAARSGYGWLDIQRSTGEKLASVLPAILILLAIGMLIGTWMLSGTIPLMIFWGVQSIDPAYMVLTAFVATAVMSLCTGTSWGSAGTLGVALMGMAVALDAPVAATAGAVVSGAYLGDKLSPLSDSTNICAIAAEADLYAHVRNMLYTALPSAGVSLIVFAAASRLYSGDSEQLPETATKLLREIDQVFVLGPAAILPPVVVVLGIVRRYPAALTMAVSSLVAMGLGVVRQGFGVADALGAAVDGFDVAMIAAQGIDAKAMSETFISLVNRGGLYSMVDTLLVILCAFLLAAGMDLSGALDKIVGTLLGASRSIFGLISATMASGGVLISLTSHGGVTALIVGGLFQRAYREHRLAPQNLSRSLEDSVTIVEPLLPWTVSAIFMSTTLGVPTVSYLPWAVFCYCGPLFSLLYAATFERTGFGLPRLADETDFSGENG